MKNFSNGIELFSSSIATLVPAAINKITAAEIAHNTHTRY